MVDRAGERPILAWFPDTASATLEHVAVRDPFVGSELGLDFSGPLVMSASREKQPEVRIAFDIGLLEFGRDYISLVSRGTRKPGDRRDVPYFLTIFATETASPSQSPVPRES